MIGVSARRLQEAASQAIAAIRLAHASRATLLQARKNNNHFLP
jgi:hypothetical protein